MDVRAQVILHTVDNLAANYVTNSWCVITTDVPDAADFTALTTCFKDFYDDLSGILGAPLAQNGHEIKYYDLAQAVPPNYPLSTNTWNLAVNPTGAGLPSEVALCLSFQGQRVSGSPQARRRGRVYIGPCTQSINSSARPSSGARGQLASAAVTLTSNLKAISNISLLGVWSHANNLAVEIEDGWVDDVWDTQRRRGVQRVSRDVWTAA